MGFRKIAAAGLLMASLPTASLADCPAPSEIGPAVSQNLQDAAEIAAKLQFPIGCDSVSSSLGIIATIKSMKPGKFQYSLHDGPHEEMQWDSCAGFLGIEKAEESIHAVCSRFGNSPTGTLNPADRARQIMVLAHDIQAKTQDKTLKKLPSATLACIAARETGVSFMPTSVSFQNCGGDRYSVSFQIGFGAIVWDTFLDILGLDVSQFKKDGKPNYLIRALKTEFGIPTSSSVKDPILEAPLREVQTKRHPLPELVSKVDYGKVKDGDPYQLNAAQLYNALSTNTELQVEFMMLIFGDKLESVGGKDLTSALENYNGSPDKEAYASAVKSCGQCVDALFKSGKSGNDVQLMKCLERTRERPVHEAED